jgi:peroxiredoxin
VQELIGVPVPPLRLTATTGHGVDLTAVGDPWAVLYLYPMTSRPGVELPEGWDEIPGARGCTPEACGFRDRHDDLAGLGAEVYGISAQAPDWQREAVERLGLPFPLLSDADHQLQQALGLPTFTADGMKLYERLTLIVRHARVVQVFHPVPSPADHAGEVARWLREEAHEPA